MNEQITLQDLRKRKYTTIKAFADAYGRSYSMVDASPEVPDTHLFEVQVDDAGNIAVSWHGC